ncbi:MBL fold metallo-hydrolase [Candidatus Sarmatiella mevalonica]|uniref:hypothetical protein n=1 Tax=Candidatus Sarmatiella mevalonica TaxID=2770581 RepID=UPI001922F437|nr:hypothetical protein [Candidatus Sarmatiella mevalonica]
MVKNQVLYTLYKKYQPLPVSNFQFYILTQEVYSIKEHCALNDVFHLIISKNLWINEVALGIKTSKGIIAITGCSHTGAVKICNIMRLVMCDKIHALFGGFHLLRSSKSKINNIAMRLKNDDIGFIAPCHCTGDLALAILEKEFNHQFLKNGVGSQYLFEL